MSRTIKFRSWDANDKRMVPWSELWEFIISSYPDRNGFAQHILDGAMQFTGLTDRNGKDIYESDLVRDEDHTYTVVWDQKLARWLLAVGSDPDEWHLNSVIAETLEVIGDIYSTPSLLEER